MAVCKLCDKAFRDGEYVTYCLDRPEINCKIVICMDCLEDVRQMVHIADRVMDYRHRKE